MLQRGADGLPGPGVQHRGQLPEVAKQQELHVGHARQVRPERHVQLGDLLNHEPVKFLHAPVADVPAHPVVGRLRAEPQVLRRASTPGAPPHPAHGAAPRSCAQGTSSRCPAGRCWRWTSQAATGTSSPKTCAPTPASSIFELFPVKPGWPETTLVISHARRVAVNAAANRALQPPGAKLLVLETGVEIANCRARSGRGSG